MLDPTAVIPRRRTRAEATAIPKPRVYAGPPTAHTLNLGDARQLDWISDESVHLVVTSPPYFNLKKYNDHPGQLGDMDDYEAFHDELTGWRHYRAMLVPAGVRGQRRRRLVARRTNAGRHLVLPLHADISVAAAGSVSITARSSGTRSPTRSGPTTRRLLGKPMSPTPSSRTTSNTLMLRKHGKYRNPTDEQRRRPTCEGGAIRLVPICPT